MIPKLKSHVGGWVAVHIETGVAVREFSKNSKLDLELVKQINFEKYMLVPVDEYLSSLNNN